MKKLPIIIMLSAAGITGVAMAQTSAGGTSTSGATPGATSMNGAAGTTGYGTSGKSGMDGAAGTYRGPDTTSGGSRTPNTSGTEIGKDLEGYGKAAGATGSKVSPAYGTTRGTTGATNGAMPSGTGMAPSGTSGMTWTCPAGYTLSTATRDGTPLCYPNTGPMPGR